MDDDDDFKPTEKGMAFLAKMRRLEEVDPAASQVIEMMVEIGADLTREGLAPSGSAETWQWFRQILEQMRGEAPPHLRPTIDHFLKTVYLKPPRRGST